MTSPAPDSRVPRAFWAWQRTMLLAPLAMAMFARHNHELLTNYPAVRWFTKPGVLLPLLLTAPPLALVLFGGPSARDRLVRASTLPTAITLAILTPPLLLHLIVPDTALLSAWIVCLAFALTTAIFPCHGPGPSEGGPEVTPPLAAEALHESAYATWLPCTIGGLLCGLAAILKADPSNAGAAGMNDEMQHAYVAFVPVLRLVKFLGGMMVVAWAATAWRWRGSFRMPRLVIGTVLAAHTLTFLDSMPYLLPPWHQWGQPGGFLLSALDRCMGLSPGSGIDFSEEYFGPDGLGFALPATLPLAAALLLIPVVRWRILRALAALLVALLLLKLHLLLPIPLPGGVPAEFEQLIPDREVLLRPMGIALAGLWLFAIGPALRRPPETAIVSSESRSPALARAAALTCFVPCLGFVFAVASTVSLTVLVNLQAATLRATAAARQRQPIRAMPMLGEIAASLSNPDSRFRVPLPDLQPIDHPARRAAAKSQPPTPSREAGATAIERQAADAETSFSAQLLRIAPRMPKLPRGRLGDEYHIQLALARGTWMRFARVPHLLDEGRVSEACDALSEGLRLHECLILRNDLYGHCAATASPLALDLDMLVLTLPDMNPDTRTIVRARLARLLDIASRDPRLVSSSTPASPDRADARFPSALWPSTHAGLLASTRHFRNRFSYESWASFLVYWSAMRLAVLEFREHTGAYPRSWEDLRTHPTHDPRFDLNPPRQARRFPEGLRFERREGDALRLRWQGITDFDFRSPAFERSAFDVWADYAGDPRSADFQATESLVLKGNPRPLDPTAPPGSKSGSPPFSPAPLIGETVFPPPAPVATHGAGS